MPPINKDTSDELLDRLMRTWDFGFPLSNSFKADGMTTLLLVDLAAIVRRARELRDGRREAPR